MIKFEYDYPSVIDVLHFNWLLVNHYEYQVILGMNLKKQNTEVDKNMFYVAKNLQAITNKDVSNYEEKQSMTLCTCWTT